MARIRTIKPEFPHSESLSRVSRDARLCFVALWTLCDDAGRARGNARMLASLLFPYDADAAELMDSWLGELESVGVIGRYDVAGKSFVAVTNWLEHQRIEKPRPSKIPPPPGQEPPDDSASPGEASPKPPRHVGEASPTLPRLVGDASPMPPRHVGEASPQEGKGKEGKGEDGNGGEGTNARSAHADAVLAYNAVACDLNWPQVQTLTPMRKTKLEQRLRECGGIAGWRDAMAKARASPFLTGQIRRTSAHENWTPDFDFFLQQSSFTRLMEGKYDDRPGSQTPTGFDALLAGARAAAVA